MTKLQAPYIQSAWQTYRRSRYVRTADADSLLDCHDAFFAGALSMFIAHRQLADIELLRVEMVTHARSVDPDWLRQISPAASLLT
jgi:hypothetical protein